jgi:hypothetical protein
VLSQAVKRDKRAMWMTSYVLLYVYIYQQWIEREKRTLIIGARMTRVEFRSSPSSDENENTNVGILLLKEWVNQTD